MGIYVAPLVWRGIEAEGVGDKAHLTLKGCGVGQSHRTAFDRNMS